MSDAHYTNVNAEQKVGLLLFKGQGLQRYTHLYVYKLNLEKKLFLSSKGTINFQSHSRAHYFFST